MREGQLLLWLHRIHTRSGTAMQRTLVTFVAGDEQWSTVERQGQRFAVRTAELRLAPEASEAQP